MEALSYAMSKPFTDVLRATTAVQVAVYELAEEECTGVAAMPALHLCVAELLKAVKLLKKSLD